MSCRDMTLPDMTAAHTTQFDIVLVLLPVPKRGVPLHCPGAKSSCLDGISWSSLGFLILVVGPKLVKDTSALLGMFHHLKQFRCGILTQLLSVRATLAWRSFLPC